MNNRNKNQGEFHFLSETIHIFLNKTEIRFDHLKKEVTICRTGVNIEYYYFYYIITLSDFFFFFTLLLFNHTEHSPQFVLMSKLYPTLGQERN